MEMRQLVQVQLSKRAQEVAAASFITEQIQEKTLKDELLRNLYANVITPEYFDQFETSHR